MKTIKITTIEVRGFGSILEVDYKLDKPGIHIIRGDNGVGKTTLFNALLWCLYGDTSKGVPKADIPTLKFYRPKGFQGTYVKLGLEIGGNQYTVLRTYKSKHQHEYNVGASDLAVIDHSQDKNIINEVSINESQKILEKLIGMDSLTFQNSVFFGQKATRFMDSPSGDKRKIFEDILSGIIGDINELHGKVSNERTSKIGEIQLLTNKVSKLEGRVEALRSRYKELGENEEKAEKLMQSKISEIRLRIQGLKNQIEEEDAQKVRSENRVVELLGKKKTVSEKLKALRHKYDIDLLEKRFIDIKARKESFTRELSGRKLDDLIDPELNIGSKCPTCGSAVTEQTIKKIQAQNDHRRKEFAKQTQKLKDRIKELAEKEAKFDGLSKIKNAEGQYKDNLHKIESEIVRNKHLIDRSKQTIKSATGEIRQLEEREKTLYEQRKNTVDELKKLKSSIESAEQESETLGEKITEKNSYVQYLDWWSRKGLGAGGVSTYLYEGLLVSFNTALQKYSQHLGMVVKLSIDKEKKSRPFVMECYDNGVLKSYESLSGGEQQRVNIGVLFALYEVICSKTVEINLLLLDEVFEGLDDVGTDMVFQVLKMYSKKSVYVITHNNDINADQVDFINVVKTKQGTQYD